MAIRVAQIDPVTKVVVNVIMLDNLSQTPKGFEGIESDTASPGDVWNGTEFVKPIQN
jgi:hypothetical protein